MTNEERLKDVVEGIFELESEPFVDSLINFKLVMRNLEVEELIDESQHKILSCNEINSNTLFPIIKDLDLNIRTLARDSVERNSHLSRELAELCDISVSYVNRILLDEYIMNFYLKHCLDIVKDLYFTCKMYFIEHKKMSNAQCKFNLRMLGRMDKSSCILANKFIEYVRRA